MKFVKILKAKNDHYIGKTVEIISMEGEPQYTGKTGVVEYVDSLGQLHGTWGGCAIIPETDSFKVIKSSQFNLNEEEEEKVKTGEQARQFIAKELRNYTRGLSGVKLLMTMRKYLMYVLSVTTNDYVRAAASEHLKHLEL